jgi:hypothetical protein
VGENIQIVETKQKKVLERLFKTGKISKIVKPSPSKARPQMSFLSGQRKSLREEQQVSLSSIVAEPSGEDAVVLEGEIKKRIFTRSKKNVTKRKKSK